MEILFLTGWPWRFSDLEPYLLRKKNDNWTHNAFEIERIKRLERSDYDEFIVFLGGSPSLEAIERDTIISRRLTEITGSRILFKSLCASLQTFTDNAKILQALGNINGIVLIGIEPLSFKKELESQLAERMKDGHLHLKYYFLSPPKGIINILSNSGLNINIYQRLIIFRTLNILGEILKKRFINSFTLHKLSRRIKHDRHAVGDRPPVNEINKKKQSKWLSKLLKKYIKYHILNRDLLFHCVQIAKKNHNRVILIDLPNNPIFHDEINSFQPHYDKMIHECVDKLNIGYIDLRNGSEWDPEDFRDIHHMRSPGQKKLSICLPTILASYLIKKKNLSLTK